MDVQRLRLGLINYWNLLPLNKELLRFHQGFRDAKYGSPAEINRWLASGEIDLAPSSSVCLLDREHIEVPLLAGVSADGPVSSVYLGLQRVHEPFYQFVCQRQDDLRNLFRAEKRSDAHSWVDAVMQNLPVVPEAQDHRVHLAKTEASASGSVLSDLFFHLWFGRRNRPQPEPGSVEPVRLLIGDEALINAPKFERTLDLSELWHSLTDLPFVFAVWQAHTAVDLELAQQLTDLIGQVEDQMHRDPSSYFPEPPPRDVLGRRIDLESYWRRINYRIGRREWQGLSLFLSFAAKIRAGATQGQEIQSRSIPL